MRSFTDAQKRPWNIEINVAAIKRVRDGAGVDLYALIDDGAKPLGELLGDPVKLVEVLYVLCAGRVEELGLQPEDFGAAFDGDALEAASEAFTEELVNFFPSRGRAILQKLKKKGQELGTKLIAQADAKLDQLDLDSLVATLSGSSGPPPASSGLTPAA